MRPTQFWALAALPFALAACGGGDEAAEGTAEGTMVTDTTTSMTPAAPMATDTAMTGATATANTVTMNAVGTSGVTGQAQFMSEGEGTMVMVNLTAQGNSTHSGHIHQGTCDAPGEVVVPLQDVTLSNGAGSSSTTIQVPLATVMNGQHIVAYHASSGDNPGAPVVCGQIPAQTGAAM
ncbi:hypothetical protein [Longimicrobium sp.]|uniref:hypothetical protein n=1 Tax=Longimicrobium sp. TaxID=2029185 RepID=UPI003B3A7352